MAGLGLLRVQQEGDAEKDLKRSSVVPGCLGQHLSKERL